MQVAFASPSIIAAPPNGSVDNLHQNGVAPSSLSPFVMNSMTSYQPNQEANQVNQLTLVPAGSSSGTQQEVIYKEEIPSNSQSECGTKNEAPSTNDFKIQMKHSEEFKATGTAFGSKSGNNSNSGSGKPAAQVPSQPINPFFSGD